ncbi:hypothetical protein llap_1997 [Limosa lapponica baueri]|uniref:Uncharacterized protein n=1 Tax=Limosa lapponica baueri TaxID=1758121 RepID=A0A2I0UNV7_LIMLA|nr:hypothetical protein llap_1997 [Limosa lapponica baueri]
MLRELKASSSDIDIRHRYCTVDIKSELTAPQLQEWKLTALRIVHASGYLVIGYSSESQAYPASSLWFPSPSRMRQVEEKL